MNALISELNTNLSIIGKWSENNGLTLNSSKTQVVWFDMGNSLKRIPIVLNLLIINGYIVTVYNSVKSMDVTHVMLNMFFHPVLNSGCEIHWF